MRILTWADGSHASHALPNEDRRNLYWRGRAPVEDTHTIIYNAVEPSVYEVKTKRNSSCPSVFHCMIAR